jgi:hypothetical protein
MIFDSLRAEKMLIEHFSRISNDIEIDDLFLQNRIDIETKKRSYKKMQQTFQRIGKAWEIILSCCEGFQKISQIDFVNKERKIYIELKNRYNTDNSSSKKTNLHKLSKFKQKNQEYTCIYGVINAKNKSYSKKHIDMYNNEILELHQNSFFDEIFGIHTSDILNFVNKFTEKYDIFNL